MLLISNLTHSVQGRLLFENLNLQLSSKQRLGLFGNNGTGKTTLLRLIAEAQEDDDSISYPAYWKLAYVKQSVPDFSGTLLDFVIASDTERSSLLEQEKTASALEISDIHERLRQIEAQSAPARAARILSGLGFDTQAQTRSSADFSGGWRMRIALAQALFIRPDLLLLDEPTNHLDFETIIWLENELKAFSKTLIVVSHDRHFLDSVTSYTAHLGRQRLQLYTGNYSQFERQRTETLKQNKRQAEKVATRRAELQAFVDRFRAKASKAKQAQSRLKQLEKLNPVIVEDLERQNLQFHFPKPTPLSPPILQIEKGEAGYAEKTILKDLNLRIDMDDRIAILGANGNGKSTLLKVLSKQLSLQKGKILRSSKLKIAYYAQFDMDRLKPNLSAYEQLKTLFPLYEEVALRSHLGAFGLSQTKADTLTSHMSGGEKARLMLALLTFEKPHILLLDEPTNHLDMDSRAALIDALNTYEGALIFVTHDRQLIELCAEQLWLVNEGRCSSWPENLESYQNFLLKERSTQKKTENKDLKTDRKKEQRRQNALLREKLAPLKKKCQRLEKEIDTLANKKQTIEQKLADPALYTGEQQDKVQKLQLTLGALNKDLEKTELLWIQEEENYDLELQKLQGNLEK